MMEKTGDLREDSHADDNYAKKAKYAEQDGPKVLASKVGSEKPLVPLHPKKAAASNKVLHNNEDRNDGGKS